MNNNNTMCRTELVEHASNWARRVKGLASLEALAYGNWYADTCPAGDKSHVGAFAYWHTMIGQYLDATGENIPYAGEEAA